MTDPIGDTLEAAWSDLLDAVPPGWTVGKPSFHRDRWSLYAYDQTERAVVGKRSREWTAVHPTQIGVLREMTRCLTEIREGRVPR